MFGFMPEDITTLIIVVIVSTIVSRVTNFILKIVFFAVIAIVLYLYFADNVNASSLLSQGLLVAHSWVQGSPKSSKCQL